MNLELASLPLAWLAGVLGVLSPCVWPLVPVVVSSAATSGRSGPWFLAAGLSAAFAAAGTLLMLLVLNLGLDPELFRYVAAGVLVVVAVMLLVGSLNQWLALQLSQLTGRLRVGAGADRGVSSVGQFGVGALLGLVWLPCVGPTLGAAITLASLGQSLAMAFLVMFAFGAGTASVLLLAGFVSTTVLSRWRAGLLAGSRQGKKMLGWMLLILGVAVLSGGDKILEGWALRWIPAWAVSF
ncbi:MAG: cytochrome c biogenesis protein CcdA [Gemmatimonadetes bacterium]|nr:cytochrome c biogenesis protein CcdA [Gemmatimonadota bacterium]